ncbi:hypothetical protein FSW04_11110 [Baekduia soli]|uniref:SCP2 sterol-binding domain-containing protein n=1 Tax=Baekduia soli TaxID=496014 RepID=A0A5B8U4R9_9ACTN|nr:hypothetical protein [Baekduia soli]QEC48063.1 hypothetical protein FSW04_11110 [Baekduia soli]
MSSDAPQLIERAIQGVLEEVPALKPLKLVVGIDLHGRGDTQQFRVQLPDLEVTKDIAADARVRIEMRRDFFNLMVEHGAKVADWEQAFQEGRAKATGVTQYLQLIARVVDKHQERARLRRAHH